jgi:hypothetical protein
MKKIIFSILLSVVFVSVNAQDTENDERDRPTTKSGKQILPVAGDYAIGLSAQPFVQYIGNLFGFTGSNNVGLVQFYNNQSIYGKYFLDDNTAIRGQLRISRFNQSVVYSDVQNDLVASDPLALEQVEDNYRSTDGNYTFYAGYEKRRGYGRLQGFYGAAVNLDFSFDNEKYSYGNEMTASNPTPTSFNGSPSNRLLSQKDRSISVGAGVFGGVEYFVARKISLQAEVGWSINYSFFHDATQERETILNGVYTSYERQYGNDQFRYVDLNTFIGNLGIFYHF